MLLDTGRVSRESVDKAFWISAQYGTYYSVEFLFSNSTISARAVKITFEGARKSIISKFLYKKLDDSAEWVMTALPTTDGCGRYTLMSDEERVAILRFLCSTGFVPDTLVCDVFTAVVGKWYGDVVVLAFCNEVCVFPDAALKACQIAVSWGKSKFVKGLLAKHCFSLPVKRRSYGECSSKWST
ncbi:hypothetical protein JG687_00017125 [Phytophthora cactorum]|uniref:Uncharacterized protein n=1 Tax=Phytophthora cactorum TaxID=29920 RepID=A0A8T1TQ62_9STRA|nr:hypothetical protein JG687_00017125 [Phytophthora cactorum]